GERADRAQVDHVARQLGVDRLAHERNDLGVLAAPDHPELHDASDFLTEAHAARALDAAGPLLAHHHRSDVLALDDALRLVIARRAAAITYREILQLAFAA